MLRFWRVSVELWGLLSIWSFNIYHLAFKNLNDQTANEQMTK